MGHYWREVLHDAFWKSLLVFFDDPIKGIGLFILGLAVTTVIVWIVRSKEAFTEHWKSNIAIPIAGGICTWLLVFAWQLFVSAYQQHAELESQLKLTQEQARGAVMTRNAAEEQQRLTATAAKLQHCVVERPTIVMPQQNAVIPSTCAIGQRQFPGQMFIAKDDIQVRNLVLLMNGISMLDHPNLGLGVKDDRNCRLRVTSPKDSRETAETIRLAEAILCRVDYSPSDDLHPEIEEEALNGAEDNVVIIHAPKGTPSTENFIGRMNQLFHVKRKYDLYHEGKPDQAIWLQVGHGFPWHIENTNGFQIR